MRCSCAPPWRSAQDLGRQTVNFTLGYFTPVGFDGRDLDDVLIANSTFLLFDIDDFNGASVGGEWLFPLARHIEGGIGVSYSSRTVPQYLCGLRRSGWHRDRSGSASAPGAAGVHAAADSRRSASAFQPYFGGVSVSSAGATVKSASSSTSTQAEKSSRTLRGRAAPMPGRSCSAASGSPATPSARASRFAISGRAASSIRDFAATEDRSGRLDVQLHRRLPVLRFARSLVQRTRRRLRTPSSCRA